LELTYEELQEIREKAIEWRVSTFGPEERKYRLVQPVRLFHINHWLTYKDRPLDCEQLPSWTPNLEAYREREIREKWDERVYRRILTLESQARLEKREKRQ
jgi:hypothetical protein